MKIPDTTRQEIIKYAERMDWEATHSLIDDLISDRLRELDPELIADIDEITRTYNLRFYAS